MRKLSILIALLFVTNGLLAYNTTIEIGAKQYDKYIHLLTNKRAALYSNHTGMVEKNQHLLDVLLAKGIKVSAIFSPEHGFRGTADAGEHISNTNDAKTGVPVLSLYDGKGSKPSPESMAKFDVLIVDIQDVGLRFYTYYITMLRLMEACADSQKQIIILDRPNPNGYYVDGPILDMKYKSGIGGLPIPVVHGMTLAELALMSVGEHWLKTKNKLDLVVVPCKNYTHAMYYELPIAPSPNLPNMLSIYLYPSVCLFEGTPVSLGRGTEMPFQVYGHPAMKDKYRFEFTPKSMFGSKNPPLLEQLCYGVDLRDVSIARARQTKFSLDYLIDAYHTLNIGKEFFTSFFVKLVGVKYIEEMILDNKSACEIQAMWRGDVESFKVQRRPYLLYPEN